MFLYLLLLNKIDLVEQDSVSSGNGKVGTEKLPNAELLPISALNKFNLDEILRRKLEDVACLRTLL